MKRAILVDSTANIGKELYHHKDIYQVNLNVYFEDDGLMFTDTWDESKMGAFYDKMRTSDTLPTTSQPSPQDFVNQFDAIKQAGYDSVMVFPIASQISGTYQTAKMIADDYEDDLDIYIVDTGTGSYGVKNMVEHTLKWYQAGYSNETILDKLQVLIEHTKVFGAIHDVTNFVKGGRISHISGNLAGVLKVGAVFSVYHGKIAAEKIARGKKRVRQAMDKIIDRYIKKEAGMAYRLAVVHANIHDTAKEKAQMLREKYPEAIDVIEENITIVLGTQLGEDMYAYIYLPEID